MAEKTLIVPIPAQEDETSEEWGVLFPDGNIDWEGHAVEGGKLRFVKRVITVSYSLPVIAKAIRNKRGES